MISTFISLIALGLSMFSASLLASKASNYSVYRPLAIFFLANSVVLICFIIRDPFVHGGHFAFLSELTLVKLIFELSLPPLFWIYVRGLTSEYDKGARPSDSWHFILPLLPCAFIAIITTSSSIATVGFDRIFFSIFISELNKLLNIIALAQFSFYVGLMMRRLIAYREKLTSLFSSTENTELRWLGTILSLVLLGISLELTAEIRFAIAKLENPFTPWTDLLRLVIFWFLAIWSMRQRPELMIETSATHAYQPIQNKYSKSALSDNHLREISSKIKNFLEVQKGYRDPDLSLSVLSKAIEVRSDYISQTLNTEIESSFFDYVNHLRVKEASALLSDTNYTVLRISNEVGFNSRSSFYKAFKKQIGSTPAAYRKKGNTHDT